MNQKMEPLLEVRAITKSFAGKQALGGVSFSARPGEIVCLLGPSGCGKTTLLRIVAGLETPDAGLVLFEGRDIKDVAPYRRNFGLMFQDYALFPHKNVFDNVAFGLRMQPGGSGSSGDDVETRVHEMLFLVGLRGFEQRNVSELSGGEAQRVALARSLAPSPRLLMLDEPLGSLDRATRERLMIEVRDILREVKVTTLYVTHDQIEAFSVADRAIIMNAGRIEQVGVSQSLYRQPANAFVAHFLGMTNLGRGQVTRDGQVVSDWGAIRTDTQAYRPGDACRVLIRPEAAQLVVDGDPAGNDCIPAGHTRLRGTLQVRSFRGGRYRVAFQPQTGPTLFFDLPAVVPLNVTPSQQQTLAIHPGGVALLAPED